MWWCSQEPGTALLLNYLPFGIADRAVRGTIVEQLADQPPKTEPGSAVATSVTVELRTKLPVHAAPVPQMIPVPVGVLTTVPVPKPTL